MRDQPETEIVEAALGGARDGVQRTEANMVDEFTKLQEQRCVAYNTLERCMREYRATKQLCVFSDTMREVTNTFQTVSQAIIQIVKDLDAAGFKDSSALIDRSQDMEQLKLKLTADAHIKQQAVNTYGREEDRIELQKLKKCQQDLIIEINELLEDIRFMAHPDQI